MLQVQLPIGLCDRVWLQHTILTACCLRFGIELVQSFPINPTIDNRVPNMDAPGTKFSRKRCGYGT
jgi:hypothetical protein